MTPFPCRIIPDVHGETGALQAAVSGSEDRHLFLLGDLVDFGPDPAGTLALALDLVESGRATLVRSNHDDRLYRHLTRGKVTVRGTLARTLEAIGARPDAQELHARFCAVYAAAPWWLRIGDYFLVHGAMDPLMLEHAAPVEPLTGRQRGKLQWLALYGEGRPAEDPDAFPHRTYEWVERIPAGITAIVGHDVRSTEAPLATTNAQGGRAIFADTGCGKGGRLSWVDLPEEGWGSARVRSPAVDSPVGADSKRQEPIFTHFTAHSLKPRGPRCAD